MGCLKRLARCWPRAWPAGPVSRPMPGAARTVPAMVLKPCFPAHPCCWREGGCRSGCPTAALPAWVRVWGSFQLCACWWPTPSAGPPGGRRLAALTPWRGEKPRAARLCHGAHGRVLAEPGSACRLVCGAHCGCPALPQRWCRGMPRVCWLCPLNVSGSGRGALRALGPLSITCEGLPSDHSLQVQSIECDELRCCEFVRKLPWEAEEHVGQRAGRGSRGGAGRGSNHGSSGTTSSTRRPPATRAASRLRCEGVGESEPRGFPGLRAPRRRARCPAGDLWCWRCVEVVFQARAPRVRFHRV